MIQIAPGDVTMGLVACGLVVWLVYRIGFRHGADAGWWAKREQIVDGFDEMLRAKDLLVYLRKDVSPVDDGARLASLCEQAHASEWGAH